MDNDYLDTPHRSPSTISLPGSPQLHRQASLLSVTKPPRIRKVSALSDFAPVNLRVKRRRRGAKHHERRQDWLFVLLRWPLLVWIFTIELQYLLTFFILDVHISLHLFRVRNVHICTAMRKCKRMVHSMCVNDT